MRRLALRSTLWVMTGVGRALDVVGIRGVRLRPDALRWGHALVFGLLAGACHQRGRIVIHSTWFTSLLTAMMQVGASTYPLDRPRALTYDGQVGSACSATQEYLGLARAAEAQSRIAPMIAAIEVLDARCEAEFLDRFAARGQPALIDLPASETSWTIARFVDELGDRPLVVRKGDDYDTMTVAQTTVETYLDPTRSTSYYAARNPVPDEILREIARPPFLRARQHPDLMHLWLGREGTQTRLHRDLLDNFAIVLDGVKHVFLVPPHRSDELDIWQVGPALQSSRVDLRSLRPAERQGLGTLEVRVREHQMLFIPCGWFHQVRNESTTLAITCFLAGFPAWFDPAHERC